MLYKTITFDQIENKEHRDTITYLREVLSKCVDGLVKAGATRYICSASKAVSNEFNVDGGEFSLFRTQFSDSLSLTVFVGDKKGTVNLNSFEESSLNEAVKTAIASANAAEPDPDWQVAPKEDPAVFIGGAVDGDNDRLFERFREFIDTVKADYPLILMEQAITSHSGWCSVYVNSSGTEFATIGGNYDFEIMFSGHEGDNASSFVVEGLSENNLDTPFIKKGRIAAVLDETQRQIYTKTFDGKFTGTLLAPPALLADLLFSAIGNFTSDSSIINKTSIWLDKIGKQVADPRLTVSFNPSDERIVHNEAYSFEGFRSKDYDLIKAGVLTGFTISAYTANKTGYDRAPNSSGAIIIAPGDKPLDEMISSIKRGIFVGRFSGGEPSINGDFSGVAKNSFLIEDGKITSALSETMISGNLADLLFNIIDISKETVENGGAVLPYVSFGNITISGK